MNPRKFRKLLGELTPDLLSYFFPGLERPVVEERTFIKSVHRSEGVLYEEMMDLDADFSAPARKASPAFGAFPQMLRKAAHAVAASQTAAAPPAPAAVPEEEALDPRTEEILAEIRRLQEKYGVSIDELEVLLGYTVRLSPVRITRSGKIFLIAYENKEVKMPNISKALYFLYLRHPEGLRYKEIAEHRDELLQLYQGLTGRDEPEEIEKSIDLLADPFGNALNVNASRIKTAFRNVVSDRIARFYYINGAAGDVKKVPLDRDLVIWEY